VTDTRRRNYRDAIRIARNSLGKWRIDEIASDSLERHGPIDQVWSGLEVLDEQLVPRADVTEVREASIDRAAGPLIEAERREKPALDERLDCERLNGTRTTIACSLHEEQRRGTAIRRLLQRALA
jgi:hypothetical protein